MQALSGQANSLIQYLQLYYNTEPQGSLASALVNGRIVLVNVFFSNSGADANEALVKSSKIRERLSIDSAGNWSQGGDTTFGILIFTVAPLAGVSATGSRCQDVFGSMTSGFAFTFSTPRRRRKGCSANSWYFVGSFSGRSGIYPASREFFDRFATVCWS